MNKLINCLSIIIFCLLIISCEEDPDVIDPDEVGIWKYYSTSNGLTNDDIRAIMQDQNGIIWVGTYGGGVCKYDNGNWSYIQVKNGLLDNRIYSIEEDEYGDIWIGTALGISVVSDEEIHNHETILGSYYLPLSLYSDSRGWMWIGTTTGILIFDYNDYYPIVFQNEDLNWIWDITEDNLNQVWFSTPGGALGYNEEENDFHLINMDDGLYSNNIHCILQDNWGNIWFGHQESERITRWNGSNFEYINLYNGYAYANVWSMVEDHNQNIWFTTANSGVICYDGVVPKTIGIKGGLKDTDIRCSMVDNEGNLWFGSDSLGIQIYVPE
jgi:ligand-binding sensor domain-containing protein